METMPVVQVVGAAQAQQGAMPYKIRRLVMVARVLQAVLPEQVLLTPEVEAEPVGIMG
jgi:hypothetical protein